MNSKELRGAYVHLCLDIEPDIMITLATNQSWSAAKMTKLIETFFGRLDRKLLGHTFNALPPHKRTDGLFFIEKPDVNVHAHGLVKIPYARTALDHEAQLIWQKLCPGGSIHIQVVHSAAGAADYCTKEMETPKYDTDQIVLLQGLMSQKSLSAPTN